MIVDFPTPGGPITPTTVNSVFSVKNFRIQTPNSLTIHKKTLKKTDFFGVIWGVIAYRKEAIDVEVPGIGEEVEGSDRR